MNIDLMLLINKQFLDTPFYGVRQMTWHLQNEGHAVNQKRIRRLMRLIRLTPINQKPDTSRPAKEHKTYPYLARAGCAWSGRLKRADTRISMDGKGRCLDNPRAFPRTIGGNARDMPRLWRSLTYECVYLHAWETGSQARAGIGRWITFYNHRRPTLPMAENPPPWSTSPQPKPTSRCRQ